MERNWKEVRSEENGSLKRKFILLNLFCTKEMRNLKRNFLNLCKKQKIILCGRLAILKI